EAEVRGAAAAEALPEGEGDVVAAAAEAEAEETTVESSVGSSMMSATRSTSLSSCIACFRLSRIGFSVLFPYLALNRTAASSRAGISRFSVAAASARRGMEVCSEDRWSAEETKVRWERLERDWRETRLECAAWAREAGSVVCRASRDRVGRRAR
ncbi:hypothetical protein KEM55_006752, partial [Ascosphaera atra]